MTVNLPLLLFGLLLLWFPRQWMRLGMTVGSRRRKPSAPPRPDEPWDQRASGDPRINFRREFTKIRNYFDLLRGTAGGLAILGGQAMPSSLAIDPSSGLPGWNAMAIKLGILGVGLLIQTLRYERQHLNFFAPVFFLTGLSVSLCSIWGALFAFVLIWGLNPMLGNAQAFLIVYGLAMAAFGIFLHEINRLLPIAAFLLCFLPVLLSLLAQRPLVIFSRKAVHPAGGEP